MDGRHIFGDEEGQAICEAMGMGDFAKTLYDKSPNRAMNRGIWEYVVYGHGFGHFLTALFSNDLKGAVSRADLTNQKALVKWVQFIYNYVPEKCQGSATQIEHWKQLGGLKGLLKQREEQARQAEARGSQDGEGSALA